MNRLLSIILFLIIFTALLSFIYVYIGLRLKLSSQLPMPWNRISWGILVFCLLLIPIGILLEGFACRSFFRDAVSWVAYTNLGFFTLVFALVIFRDVFFAVYLGADKVKTRLIQTKNPAHALQSYNPDRRQFLFNLTSLGVLGASSLLTGYGIFKARQKPRVKRVDIPIKNLPQDLEGFSIAQITDIHVCPTIDRRFVEMVVDQVNRLQPDTVALTGDLVDGSVSSRKHEVEPLKNLTAKYGLFFVTGNHEYYSGVEEWIEEIKQLGFRVLLNTHELVRYGQSQVLMAGVTDFDAGNFSEQHISSPQAAIHGAPPCPVRILLAHQPKNIKEAARAGFDIQLSGHTHGGQYIPFNYLVRLAQPFISGLHRFKDTWIYVNQGTGYWGPPLRIGTEPEITLVKLKKA